MTTETRCQRAYRNFRTLQLHADAVLKLPITDMDPQEMDNLVTALNAAYDEYRLGLSMSGCATRRCFGEMVHDVGGAICPGRRLAA